MKKIFYTSNKPSLLCLFITILLVAYSKNATGQHSFIESSGEVLRLGGIGNSPWMSLHTNSGRGGYMWLDNTNLRIQSDNGNLSLFGDNIGVSTSAPGYKLDVVGNRIRIRNSTSATARTLMMRTDGAAVDLHALNADLFLRAEGNDININPFTTDGVVWVNGTSLASGATVEEFNVVGSDMNLEDTDPYLRFVRTGASSFNVGGLDFKEGSTSEYRMNYDYSANKLFFSKGFSLDGTEDVTINSTTGDLDVRRNIFFGSVEGFKDGGSNIIEAISANFHPTGDNQYSIGASGSRWSAVWAADGTINTSDRRLKKNIQSSSYGLNEVMKMKPVSFEWNESKRIQGKHIGFIAQDLLEVIPEVVVTTEMVRTADNGAWTEVPVENLGVKYADIIPVLTKAIQEQQVVINSQNDVIATLEKRMGALENRANTKN